VDNWWALAQRGEVTTRGMGELCRAMLADAVRRRLRPGEWRDWARGPAAVVLGGVVLAAVLVGLSGGLTVTRGLWEAATGPALRPHGYDPRSDRLFGYMVPIVSALSTGLFCAVASGLHAAAGGWRYWSFLSFKLTGVLILGPLYWIEGGSWLRTVLPSEGARVIFGGLFLSVGFVCAFGYGVMWCLRDQRLRCPVCLRRLTMPVTLGSWASMFEPAATEMLCEEGHGALCVAELERGQPDRWTPLDASWREFFEGEQVGKG
jgi:hypothetical protein